MVNWIAMDEKTLSVLEFSRVLTQLEKHAAFSVAAEQIRRLQPVNDFDEIRRRQQLVREARVLINTHDEIGVGGARDVRDLAGRARRSGVLEAGELLEISNTLASARTLMRRMEKISLPVEKLKEIAVRLNPPAGIIDAVSMFSPGLFPNAGRYWIVLRPSYRKFAGR